MESSLQQSIGLRTAATTQENATLLLGLAVVAGVDHHTQQHQFLTNTSYYEQQQDHLICMKTLVCNPNKIKTLLTFQKEKIINLARLG